MEPKWLPKCFKNQAPVRGASGRASGSDFGRFLEGPRGSPEAPESAPGAPGEPQEVQNEPQEAPNDPQEGQNEPQEGQSELREVPGSFRERFRNDFRSIFEQPARASKGCTRPTTLAILMLAMLSPRLRAQELSLIHISEPTRLRRISYAVVWVKK